jgi:predicted Holliday junction resolvase-like endonuclease
MNKYLIDKLNSLNSDQLKLFNDIQKNKLLQICIPTGAGKGYLMMIDILNRILNSQETIFAISSHRLMLNTQHLNDLFEMLSPFVGNIGFVFVGSSKYDTSKFQNNPFLNKSLLKSKLSYDEIISSTTNTKEVDESKSVMLGKMWEQIVPHYRPTDFTFIPSDARFLGSPVDFVIFKGASEGEIEEVVFLEIKTSKSRMNSQQVKMKKIIDSLSKDSKVRWETINIPIEMDKSDSDIES